MDAITQLYKKISSIKPINGNIKSIEMNKYTWNNIIKLYKIIFKHRKDTNKSIFGHDVQVTKSCDDGEIHVVMPDKERDEIFMLQFKEDYYNDSND